MKHKLNGATRRSGNALSHTRIFALTPALLFICLMILFSSCQKEAAEQMVTETAATTARNTQANVLNLYSAVPAQAQWELQQARAATAKYRNIENAIRDGYADISVDVQHMGHHYMNAALVDDKFDYRQPEILVYNRNADGKQELVAVEYAVPLSEPKPAGFTGDADEWNGTSGFPLWLLHAWVWNYNPNGVFAWTNPLVDLN